MWFHVCVRLPDALSMMISDMLSVSWDHWPCTSTSMTQLWKRFSAKCRGEPHFWCQNYSYLMLLSLLLLLLSSRQQNIIKFLPTNGLWCMQHWTIITVTKRWLVFNIYGVSCFICHLFKPVAIQSDSVSGYFVTSQTLRTRTCWALSLSSSLPWACVTLRLAS